MKSLFDNDLDKLKLTFGEFNFFANIAKDLSTTVVNNYESTINDVRDKVLRKIQTKYKNTQSKILNYKQEEIDALLKEKQFEQSSLDGSNVIAYKFMKGRPEIYVIMENKQPILLLDEFRFDAYNNGPFKKPTWTL